MLVIRRFYFLGSQFLRKLVFENYSFSVVAVYEKWPHWPHFSGTGHLGKNFIRATLSGKLELGVLRSLLFGKPTS